jgi:hypothetical protein
MGFLAPFKVQCIKRVSAANSIEAIAVRILYGSTLS